MTPERRHKDAISAAREWRDEQRSIPRKGDRILVRWPGGPYDFDMEFVRLREDLGAHAPGWLWLVGIVGWSELDHGRLRWPDVRTLYARPIGDSTFEMVPRRPPLPR
ncbi:hypothetical protein [Paractinoplanes hotanensis]|uniref:Uncharacterized protein n=1 Tax=Paractinoplanes hotanensis TaxID=2906497 RepID=A0ABT0Y3F0_9ACTN|nr:hypothetical protein [Actinoplanes hotanensis]MCM4080400.1 hypothetical protein [Actinoplanes hotanensis]